MNIQLFILQAVPEGRLFGLDAQTVADIGIQLFNGIFLAVVLGFLLYNPVKNFMAERTARIEKQISDSEKAMAEANKMKALYQGQMDEIKQERLDVLEKARIQAEQEQEAIRRETRREVEDFKVAEMQKLDAERANLKAESKAYIFDVANTIAQNYVAEAMSAENQERLFQAAIAELEESEWKD